MLIIIFEYVELILNMNIHDQEGRLVFEFLIFFSKLGLSIYFLCSYFSGFIFGNATAAFLWPKQISWTGELICRYEAYAIGEMMNRICAPLITFIFGKLCGLHVMTAFLRKCRTKL